MKPDAKMVERRNEHSTQETSTEDDTYLRVKSGWVPGECIPGVGVFRGAEWQSSKGWKCSKERTWVEMPSV